MKRALSVCAVALAAACASTATYDRIRTERIFNAQGHVVGHKDVLREAETGAEISTVAYYSPKYDASGAVVAYEEQVPDGVVIRNLSGRRIGMRYNDLRSSGLNPGSGGITVIVPGALSD